MQAVAKAGTEGAAYATASISGFTPFDAVIAVTIFVLLTAVVAWRC